MATGEHEPGRGLVAVDSPLTMDAVIGNLRRPENISIEEWEGVSALHGMIRGMNGSPRVDISGENPATNLFDVYPFTEGTDGNGGSNQRYSPSVILSYTPTQESMRALGIHARLRDGLLFVPLTTRPVFAARTTEERAVAIEAIKGKIQEVSLGITSMR